MRAGKFRKWKFKAHGARQHVIDGAKHRHGEEAIEAQLRFRRAEPGKIRHPADLRTRHRHQHQSRQQKRVNARADVFGLFYHSLLENLVRSSLGDSLYKGFGSHFSLGTRLVRKIFIQDQKQWLEGIDPEQILLTSFEKGITQGRRLMGSEADKWTWGKIHAAEFIHPLGVRSRFMESLYQVGPVPVSGSVDAINFAGGAPSEFFKIVEGVSLRQISDITGPPQVFAASPMGISAHFFSGHYKDQMRVWADGRLFQYSVDFADAQKEDSGAVLFRPTRVEQISMGD